MPKWNGGVIGVANNPTISSAKGIWSLSEATKAIRAGLWPPSNAGADPYFENVTMLLSADGTNGAQNNTFLDSSTNNFTITRNGNTTQGTFTPFSKVDGRWANYFDGSGDYLSAASNAAFALGTGDFTVETFAYYANQSNIDAIAVANWDGVTWGSNKWSLHLDHTTARAKITFWFHNYSSSAALLTSTTTLAIGQWYHVAVSRSGNTFRLFVNGALEASATNSSSIDGGNNSPIHVGGGGGGGGSQYFTGYLSSTRLIKGTAQYTAAFTTPTSPLTAVSGTSLLTCQSNRFIDNSTNAFALTVTGNPSVQTFSPFPTLTAYASGTNGGSGYFDGSGDYLTVADNAAFEFGSGDFTIELWVNTTSSSQYDGLVTKESGAVGGAWSLMINSSSSTAGDVAFWSYDYNSFSGAMVITTGASIRDGGWHHIALVRNGSSWAIYIDGVSRGTQTSSATLGNSSADVWIGNTQSTPTRDFPGYMSGLRIVKGTAVYTAGFTPPTAPPTAITNTSLLCNFTNGGIIDNAMSNDLETVGNAQISTTQSKFGGASMYFDGNDKCVMPYTQNFNLGTTYTIEAWIYPTTVSGYQRIFDIVNSATSSPAFLDVALNGTALVSELRTANGGGVTTISGGTVSANTWSHVALSVSAGSAKLFLNGTQVGSTTTLSALPDQNFVGIGGIGNSLTIDYLTGYIDDLRITKGYARYTANFTAPTAPFPLFGD